MKYLFIAAMFVLTVAPNADTTTDRPIEQVTAECGHVWKTLYPWSYSQELADFFIQEHNRYGFLTYWKRSLVYGACGSSLKSNMTYSAGGMTTRGLMDCTQFNASKSEFADMGRVSLHNPKVSIRNHLIEMQEYHSKGYAGWKLLRKVFIGPKNPNGRRAMSEYRKWLRKNTKHESVIQSWYDKEIVSDGDD